MMFLNIKKVSLHDVFKYKKGKFACFNIKKGSEHDVFK